MGWNGDVFSNSSLPFIFHLREPCCINQLHTRQQQRSTRLTRTRMCVIHLALPESNFPFLKNRLWIFLISNFRAIHFLRQVDREKNSPPPSIRGEHHHKMGQEWLDSYVTPTRPRVGVSSSLDQTSLFFTFDAKKKKDDFWSMKSRGTKREYEVSDSRASDGRVAYGFFYFFFFFRLW
jgi:hypothetical protein